MSHPVAGEPYWPPGGYRLSVGDLGAAPGTIAFKGVIVIDHTGIPSPNVIDPANPLGFNIKAYFLTRVAGPLAPLGPTFIVQFHIHDLAGGAVGGSPFGMNPIFFPDVPAGNTAPPPGDNERWHSVTSVNVPPGTLLAGNTYRVTVEASDPTPGNLLFAFHDGTIIYAS